MDLRIRSTSDRGVTLLEVLLVIGIIGLLASVGTTAYTSFRAHENLALATTGVVEALRHAAANAQSGKGDSQWGVSIAAGAVTIFKGAAYASRDAAFDQTLVLPANIIPSGAGEVIFEKMTGKTLPGTITLSSPAGVRTISINTRGMITYE